MEPPLFKIDIKKIDQKKNPIFDMITEHIIIFGKKIINHDNEKKTNENRKTHREKIWLRIIGS